MIHKRVEDMNIDEYQAYLKERQELLAYCKKISQGIENLDERSGERAIWELIQNARDLDENCCIKIQLLLNNKLIFSHHGKPFDYLSLLALVNQNSSKDNPGADVVGQYGTGFMTTHAFNNVVTVDGPFKAMHNPTKLKGYVELGEFKLDRSYCIGDYLEEAIPEMREEMGKVAKMHNKEPLYPELPDKWTSFTYEIASESIESISNQLECVVRFMPFVLTINERIREVEIIDEHRGNHYCIKKENNVPPVVVPNHSDWSIVENLITYTYYDGTEDKKLSIRSLQSNDKNDIVIIPPYPVEAGDVSSIPSLFLWFPLLGTEDFGVNFIFHSKRFYPVEKRNNILIPENVPSKKEKGERNEAVLKEMMGVLFDFYKCQINCKDLSRDFCCVNFKSDKEDEVTVAFYKSLQNLWKEQIISWEVIPTDIGKLPITDCRVRVLHDEFYSSLTGEQRKKYEPTLAHFAQKVQRVENEMYHIPTSDLIAWSETVNQWQYNRSDFFISVNDVCLSIKQKSDELKAFLNFLNESGNSTLLDSYALLPNRKGVLKKKGDLCHGDFMTSSMYDLTKGLMGTDADKMIDTEYNTIATVASYSGSDLQKAITQTISQWRKRVLGTDKEALTEEELNILIAFCSATSQDEFKNYRGKMICQIVKIFDKEFNKIQIPCPVVSEEDFYASAFNLLMDYTLYTISQKDAVWVETNIDKLTTFLSSYAESKADEKLAKLSTYGVIPNCNFELTLLNDLYKNIDIDETLAKLYKDVTKEDLSAKWVHLNFSELYTYKEQKAQDVANSIQNKLSDDNFTNPIVLDIIELTEDTKMGDHWAALFKIIHAQKESIRYNLGSDEERKAINRMMKKKNPELLTLMADVVDREDASLLLQKAIDQANTDSYHERLGNFVERHIQQYIEDGLKDIGVVVTNQQFGQDIIISKDGYEDYHVEVKSRWNSEKSVEMTKTQLECAVLAPDRYALIGVNMYRFDRERALNNTPLSLDEIYDNIRVLDNIGKLESEIKKRADEVFENSDTAVRLSGEYKARVPQQLFKDRKLEFNEFLEDLKVRFSKEPTL